MSSAPSISVVIPTFNRPRDLSRLLRALTKQDMARELFEVIVIDDGGEQNLLPVLQNEGSGLKLSLFRQDNQGPAAARNHGAKAARGEYLAFIDDDCEPLPGWLSALHNTLCTKPQAVCGGPVFDGPEGNAFSQATALLHDYLQKTYNPSSHAGGFYTTNNLAISAKGLAKLGGFDARMRYAEDREFCYRWSCMGGEFLFAPDAVVRHHHSLGLGSFMSLHFRYGQGTAHFHRITSQNHLPRVKLSLPQWYLDLVLYGLRSHPGRKGLILSALTACSQVFYLAGILWANGCRSFFNQAN